MEILVNGVVWLLRFSRLRGKAMGWCYFDTKKILVDSRLKGKDRLDVLIHEMLHAHHRQLSEEAVTQTASDIAEVLWKIGYRDCNHGYRDVES